MYLDCWCDFYSSKKNNIHCFKKYESKVMYVVKENVFKGKGVGETMSNNFVSLFGVLNSVFSALHFDRLYKEIDMF